MLRIGTPHRVRDTCCRRSQIPRNRHRAPPATHKRKTAGSRDPAVLNSQELKSRRPQAAAGASAGAVEASVSFFFSMERLISTAFCDRSASLALIR
ncbi:hypothetical protein BH11PSE4_BH11PSE4_23840 [soil metagenome]